MQLISTRKLSTELGVSGNTILGYADVLSVGKQYGDKKNAPFMFTQKEVQKIREYYNSAQAKKK